MSNRAQLFPTNKQQRPILYNMIEELDGER